MINRRFFMVALNLFVFLIWKLKDVRALEWLFRQGGIIVLGSLAFSEHCNFILRRCRAPAELRTDLTIKLSNGLTSRNASTS